MCRFGVPPRAHRGTARWTLGIQRAGSSRLALRHRRGGGHVLARAPNWLRVTNTLIATGPGVDAHYHKIHLDLDAFGFTESRTVAPGSDPVVITVDGIGVGLTTCPMTFASPSSTSSWRDAEPGLITVHASWGAGPGESSSSGRCWPGPAPWTPPASSRPSIRRIPATRWPPSGLQASVAAWWSPQRAKCGPRGGFRPVSCSSPTSISTPSDVSPRQHRRAAQPHRVCSGPVRQNRGGDRSLGSPASPAAHPASSGR